MPTVQGWRSTKEYHSEPKGPALAKAVTVSSVADLKAAINMFQGLNHGRAYMVYTAEDGRDLNLQGVIEAVGGKYPEDSYSLYADIFEDLLDD